MTWVYESMQQFYDYNWAGAKTLYPLLDLTELYNKKEEGYCLYGDYDEALREDTNYVLNRTVREFAQESESYVLNILFLDNVSYFLTGEL